MGKHSKPEPKRISFLASTGGALAGLALVGGLFAASSVNKPDEREPTDKPIAEAPRKVNPTTDPLLLGNATVQTTTEVSVERPSTPVGATETPTAVPPPEATPEPPQGRSGPTVDTDVNVQIPPVVGVDVDAEVELPLVGQLLDATTGVAEKATKTVKDTADPVIGTVKDLLGK